MKNIGYKKGFVFVIIVVMLLTVPSSLATFTPNVVKTLNNNIKSVGKPDLVILDIKETTDYMYWYLYAVVLNDGDGEVPGRTERTLRCVAMKPMSRRAVVDHTYPIGGFTSPIPPGGISHGFRLGIIEPRAEPGIYKVYFEVDPDDVIDESNEYNNVVWAYYILHWIDVWNSPTRLTPLLQVFRIPGSMPLNIPSN